MALVNLILLILVGVATIALAKETAKERLTIDGRQFTINQKDFKPSTFMLYGQEYVDTYGFVSTDYLPLDNRGYAELMEAVKFESQPFHEYSKWSTLNFYKNTADYDVFKGYDLIPENKDNYVPGTFFANTLNFKDGKKKFLNDQTVMMQTSRIPQDDGGAWHVQRIGPMISTGGYDWWQLSWPDIGMLSEAVKKYPDGIDVTSQFFGTVLKDGTRLNYPPLHTHHMHTLPQPGVRVRLNDNPMCLKKLGLGIEALDNMVKQTLCYNISMGFEQHGDYNCQPQDDGLDCLTQGDKNPRRLNYPLDVEGEINDARPPNSEPLEWYYQVAFKWKPADKKTDPISQLFLLAPGHMFPPSQLTKSFTYPAPTKAQNFMTYTSKMMASGELVRLKSHAHAGILEGSFILRGVPSDFGIGDSKFIPPLSYNPLITTELGFRDNEDLAQHILYHMKMSQEVYDTDCVGKKNLRNDMCKRPRPDLICTTAVDSATAEFGGVKYEFDRRPKSWCKDWTFTVGEDFTAVGFNKHVTAPPGPHAPDTIPEFMMQHLTSIVSYRDKGAAYSSINSLASGHNGYYFDFHLHMTPPMMLARMFCVLVWGSPPIFYETVWLLEWCFTALFTAMAGGVVYLLFKGLRKIPTFDGLVVTVVDNVLLYFSVSAKVASHATPLAGAGNSNGNGKDHAYEMVSLMDEDAAAELEDERTM